MLLQVDVRAQLVRLGDVAVLVRPYGESLHLRGPDAGHWIGEEDALRSRERGAREVTGQDAMTTVDISILANTPIRVWYRSELSQKVLNVVDHDSPL